PPHDGTTMDFFTGEHLLRMGLELTLGLCIKLFLDNGRIHYRDFLNDFLFWLPGMQPQLAGDGLSRQIAAMDLPSDHEESVSTPHALAAK
ncbi:MAG: hypothetical protein ABMB14_10945, partial [Myxococcota bacterium]